MNARMRRIEGPNAGLLVIAYDAASGVQSGRWTRFLWALKRTRLLLGSPAASFRWAMAKRKAAARKEPVKTSGWQGRRKNSFAECEQDGIVMGF